MIINSRKKLQDSNQRLDQFEFDNKALSQDAEDQ